MTLRRNGAGTVRHTERLIRLTRSNESMKGGWRYRFAAVGGTVAISAAVIALVNNTTVLALAVELPLLRRLPADAPQGSDLYFELLTGTVAFTVAMVPLYKLRPRRILDTIFLCQRLVILAMIALAAIGYFDYTYRLPRLTVLLATPLLLLTLPWWFVWIRRRPVAESERAVIIGDDPAQISDIVEVGDHTFIGYLGPVHVAKGLAREPAPAIADGGTDLPRLGGLSRIEDVLVEQAVDTAVLAFEETDRGDFFGALDACYEYGVLTKVHREYADTLLMSSTTAGPLVEVDLEPWDWIDHAVKRAFDIAFSAIGLVVTMPITIAVAIAIKLDDGGPVFYSQERTKLLGSQFTFTKFRTLRPDSERATPFDDDEANRTTRVGRFLRKTHLDEIPQLVAILRGHMTVVGPRAGWIQEEEELLDVDPNWQKRWFVKPGLTGLAQINNVGTTEPEKLVQYDLEYIKNQSFVYDLKILARQFASVAASVTE